MFVRRHTQNREQQPHKKKKWIYCNLNYLALLTTQWSYNFRCQECITAQLSFNLKLYKIFCLERWTKICTHWLISEKHLKQGYNKHTLTEEGVRTHPVCRMAFCSKQRESNCQVTWRVEINSTWLSSGTPSVPEVWVAMLSFLVSWRTKPTESHKTSMSTSGLEVNVWEVPRWSLSSSMKLL